MSKHNSKALWVLFFSLFLVGSLSVSAQSKDRSVIQFVTLEIRSHKELKEILGQLRQIDGVDAVKLMSEAPGLQTFQVTFLASSNDFFDKALAVFGDHYTLKDKKLPGGTIEINLARR